jgi:hypothetical protein
MSYFRIRLALASLFFFGFLAIFAQGAYAERTLSVIFIHTGGSESGSRDGEAIANLLRKNGFYVRGIDNLAAPIHWQRCFSKIFVRRDFGCGLSFGFFTA